MVEWVMVEWGDGWIGWWLNGRWLNGWWLNGEMVECRDSWMVTCWHEDKKGTGFDTRYPHTVNLDFHSLEATLKWAVGQMSASAILINFLSSIKIISFNPTDYLLVWINMQLLLLNIIIIIIIFQLFREMFGSRNGLNLSRWPNSIEWCWLKTSWSTWLQPTGHPDRDSGSAGNLRGRRKRTAKWKKVHGILQYLFIYYIYWIT